MLAKATLDEVRAVLSRTLWSTWKRNENLKGSFIAVPLIQKAGNAQVGDLTTVVMAEGKDLKTGYIKTGGLQSWLLDEQVGEYNYNGVTYGYFRGTRVRPEQG